MHQCPNNKAAVINGEYRSGCKDCLHTNQKSSLYARKYARDRMREDYRKDMLQRYDGENINPEWVKANEEQAVDGLGQEAVEKVLRG